MHERHGPMRGRHGPMHERHGTVHGQLRRPLDLLRTAARRTLTKGAAVDSGPGWLARAHRFYIKLAQLQLDGGPGKLGLGQLLAASAQGLRLRWVVQGLQQRQQRGTQGLGRGRYPVADLGAGQQLPWGVVDGHGGGASQ